MYAAAGGASLASRQARQRQRQQKKTQQLQAKLHPPKAASLLAAEHGASTPTRSTSRQFHQLPTNYLRAPQAHGRKLSASYTGQSKLQLLPIDEGDTQSVLHMRHGHAHGGHRHGHGHGHSHGHAHQPPVPGPGQVAHHGLPYQHAHHHYVHVQGRASPKLIHRHSGSSGTSFHHSHLPKSATATLPLVSQVDATPPTTPSAHGARGAQADQEEEEQAAIDRCQIPVPQDNIIVTPATPMASPGHEAKRQEQEQQQLSEDLPEAAAEKQPLTAADEDEAMQPPPGPLERKCSVYRMRRSDAFEQDASPVDPPSAASVVGGLLGKKQLRELQFQQQYEPLILDEPSLVFKGLPNGRKWQPCAYCEEGICVCEHIECAQGRAAWLERGRRCSVQDSQQAAAACHRRWVKRNRIQDASLGGSSDDEDFLGVLRGPSTFANAFLYVGLGTIALGLVIAFVGTGEKGFKTVELRLIGPSLIGLGLVCCILRILFCICPSHCISSGKKARKKNGNKVDADHTTSLLRGENKRVSIARGPSMQRYPITHKRSNSKMLNEGMEALRQIATTSLFMQNEQKPTATNRVVPIIREPQSAAEAPLEMKKLETALNVCEISDDEDSPTTAKSPTIAASSNNAMRTTTAITAMATTTTMTSASTSSKERPPLLRSGSKLSRQRVALHQQQQDKEKEKEQGQSQDQDAKQPQSLSSSSTVKDGSQDGDLLMETSLMVAPPTSADASVAPTTTRPPTQSTSHTGAISRVLSAPLGYDMPSAVPHTYAAAKSSAMSTSRSAASSLLASVAHPESRGESRVRGPLGMPLSALAATAGRYAYPATPSAAATTTTTTSTMSTSLTTTTTVALLPLPAPPALTTAAATDQSSIPGQVMSPEAGSRPGSGSGVHTTSLSKLLPTTTITTTSTTRTSPAPSTTATATATAMSSLATTSTTGSRASAAATTQFQQQQPQHFQQQQSQQLHSQQQQSQHAQLLQPTRATLATPPAATLAPPGGIFKFPTPLTSSSASSSAPSSASSNGRTPGATLATLAPPPMPMALPTTPSSKFEPELVLSPAKLGQ